MSRVSLTERQVTPAKELKFRAEGLCPHESGAGRRKCDRARLCSLTRQEACLTLILNKFSNCYACKKAKGGPAGCVFKCFREGRLL